MIVELGGRYIVEPSDISKVCTLVRQTGKGMKGCERSGAILSKEARETTGPVVVPCENIGFADAFAPIVASGRHVVTWLAGQFCRLDVDRDRIKGFAKEVGADADAMVQAFDEMEGRKIDDFESEIALLWLFPRQLPCQSFGTNFRFPAFSHIDSKVFHCFF